MTTYRSYSNGKKYNLIKGTRIGAGAFGAVGNIEGRKEFVYKDICLTPKAGEWVTSSREMRIKSTYRELYALKKLGLLEGYIRENDTITIIMRKIQGTPEMNAVPNPEFNPLDPYSAPSMIDVPSFFNKDKSVASFKALLEINRKGVYHIDPNPGNVLLTQAENGDYSATWVDFGMASDFSYLSKLAQILGFHEIRLKAYTDNTLEKIKATRSNFHKKEYYFYAGLSLAIGAGIVCGFGPTSFLACQIIRSKMTQVILREIRALLDAMDNTYCRNLNVPGIPKRALLRKKALINLGYVLLNLYTFTNLFYSVPNLKLTADFSVLLQELKNLNPRSLDTISAHIYTNCITPLVNGLLTIINNPSQYAQVFSLETLDKPLAEMVYLYSHLKDTIACFTNMIEKALPAEHLLYQSDVLFKYNPNLFFTYAKTKVKEAVCCIKPAEEQEAHHGAGLAV